VEGDAVVVAEGTGSRWWTGAMKTAETEEEDRKKQKKKTVRRRG
jgi:hypothetical protein